MAGFPWFKLWIKNWTGDRDLAACSLATKAVWLEILIYMFSKGTPKVTLSVTDFARRIGCHPEELKTALNQLKSNDVCPITFIDDDFEIYSSRAEIVINERVNKNLRQEKYRNKSKSDGSGDGKSDADNDSKSDAPKKSIEELEEIDESEDQKREKKSEQAPPRISKKTQRAKHCEALWENKDCYQGVIFLSKDERDRLIKRYGQQVFDLTIENMANWIKANLSKNQYHWEDHSAAFHNAVKWNKGNGQQRPTGASNAVPITERTESVSLRPKS